MVNINKVVSLDEMQGFFISLDFLNVIQWKRRYDTDILDGEQWEIIIANTYKKTIYGSNAYPENFDIFLEVIEDLFGENPRS